MRKLRPKYVSVLVTKSCPTLCDPMDCIAAHQAPLSMEFSRQEYWSWVPFPPPGDLPNPGTETTSLTSPALAGGFMTTSAAWEAQYPEKQPTIPVCWSIYTWT